MYRLHLAVGLAVVVILAAVIWVVVSSNGDDPPNSSATGSTSLPTAGSTPPAATSATPPGPSDVVPPPDGQVSTSPPPPTNGRIPVSVVVAYSGWDPAGSVAEATVYVDGVVESNGTCTMTLTGASGSAAGQARAIADATTTSCGTIQIPSSALGAGSWTGVVTYDSGTAAGSSAPFTIEVP